MLSLAVSKSDINNSISERLSYRRAELYNVVELPDRTSALEHLVENGGAIAHPNIWFKESWPYDGYEGLQSNNLVVHTGFANDLCSHLMAANKGTFLIDRLWKRSQFKDGKLTAQTLKAITRRNGCRVCGGLFITRANSDEGLKYEYTHIPDWAKYIYISMKGMEFLDREENSDIADGLLC